MSSHQNQLTSVLAPIPARADAKPKSTIQKKIDKKKADFEKTYQRKLLELRKMDCLAKEQTLAQNPAKGEPSGSGSTSKAKMNLALKQQRAECLRPVKPIYEKVFIDHKFDFSMKIISSRL